MLHPSAALQPWGAYAVAAIFLIGALVNLAAPGRIREDYARWGYPAWFRFVTAGLEAVACALILAPATRIAGLALGMAILLAAIATLVRARQYAHAVPALLFLILSGLLI